MHTVQKLIKEVSNSRNIDQFDGLTESQGQGKPNPESWNIAEITEHLFWAEQGGIMGMWKTLYLIREGKIDNNYESIHLNMRIEEIIDLTWLSKEVVPTVAAPRIGGPLSLWIASLKSLQEMLDSFGSILRENELRLQSHPHPISGPLDFHQRLEFLRFHIDRHLVQSANIKRQLG